MPIIHLPAKEIKGSILQEKDCKRFPARRKKNRHFQIKHLYVKGMPGTPIRVFQIISILLWVNSHFCQYFHISSLDGNAAEA